MAVNLRIVFFINVLLCISSLLFAKSSGNYYYFSPDSLQPKTDTVKPKIKSSGLDDVVTYAAEDSMTFDVNTKQLFLYGKADVKYTDIKLDAAYIELDMAKNNVYAIGKPDSTGKIVDSPFFVQDSHEFKSKEMRYNFESKKGLISQVITKEGEGYLHGEVIKRDSSNTFYIKNGKYTTCSNEEDPHFFISAPKIKMIPDDKIVTGPAYLVISDIPTPLALPFGFFPTKNKQAASGILIPAPGQSNNLGIFLKDGGYYWAVNDYMDLTLQADLYTRGSWAAKATSNYKLKYRYNGNYSIRYSNIKIGRENFPNYENNKTFFVRWNHNQDPKARPNSKFSADVNAGTSNFSKYGASTGSDYLTNTYQSSIRYDKSWSGTPFNLSANLRHSQNNITKVMDVSLPDVVMSMNRIYPLKKEGRLGGPNWIDNLGLSYTGNIKNDVRTTESGISKYFQDSVIDLMKNGMKHSVPLSTSVKFFKYLTFNPNVSYSEIWYLNKYEKSFIPLDSTVVTDKINGFNSTRDLNLNASFTTKMYGMYAFKSSNIKAIRHVLTPNIGFTYNPALGKLIEGPYGYKGATTKYSPYESNVFGGATTYKSSTLNFDLINNIEMKVRSSKDTVSGTKKIKLFENLQVGSSYNFAADSLNLNPITLGARTQLFESINIVYNSSFDPYAVDSIGIKRNEFNYINNESLLRLTNAQLAVNFTFKSKHAKSKTTSNKTSQTEMDKINANRNAYVDFNVPWSLNANYNLNYLRNDNITLKDKKEYTQTVSFSGDVSLTKKWKIGFNSGYDFTNKDVTYTSLNIYRDLHCWEMQFNMVPFGFRKSYSFTINVKASVLQDLKLTRRRDWQDLR